MNASQPETPMAYHSQRKGEFTMEPEEARNLQPHPYCLWFPSLSASAYEELSDSVKFDGLLEPIILLDGQILDGRHRLRACLEGDTPPRFHNFDEVAAGLSPINWVLARNLYRRHLTDDQALAIVTTANGERLIAEAAARKTEGRKHGGRGKKKNLNPESGSSFQRAIGEMHASSAVGQLAADAKSTRHKAAQALAVQKAAPDLLDQVAKGEMKLKDAHARVTAAKGPQPRHESSYMDDKTKVVAKVIDVMRKHQCRHGDLRQAILTAVEHEIDGGGHRHASAARRAWITAFADDLQSGITQSRTQTGLMGYGAAGLVHLLDWVQQKLAFIADLQAEITRRRSEADAASGGAASDKQLLRIIDSVQSELERFKREQAQPAGKPKAK